MKKERNVDVTKQKGEVLVEKAIMYDEEDYFNEEYILIKVKIAHVDTAPQYNE